MFLLTKIYACLIGNWVCLNDDLSCTIGNNGSSPSLWWEENADIWAPLKREQPDTLYQFDYVRIHYNGKSYRINPIFIQIVEES